mmetsp:Transcript_89747/g.279253  ORF Transcript_89747/g.279253 Transcript_89747/m.279253 type:complete len:95 (-) Transcript_89747:300-584(-)
MAEKGPGGLPSTRVYFDPSKHDVPAQQLWGQHIAETPSWLDDPRGSFQSELNEMYQQEMHELNSMDANGAPGVSPHDSLSALPCDGIASTHLLA